MSKQNDDYIYYTDESTNPEHYITPNETHEPNRKKSNVQKADVGSTLSYGLSLCFYVRHQHLSQCF